MALSEARRTCPGCRLTWWDFGEAAEREQGPCPYCGAVPPPAKVKPEPPAAAPVPRAEPEPAPKAKHTPRPEQRPSYKTLRSGPEAPPASVQLKRKRRPGEISAEQSRWRSDFASRSGYRPPRDDE